MNKVVRLSKKDEELLDRELVGIQPVEGLFRQSWGLASTIGWAIVGVGLVIQFFFWWVERLLFLYRPIENQLPYHIHHSHERMWAFIGFFLFIAAVFFSLANYPNYPTIPLGICALAFAVMYTMVSVTHLMRQD